MKRTRSATLAVFLVAAPVAALAAPTATLSDFGWLAGRWVDDSGGNRKAGGFSFRRAAK